MKLILLLKKENIFSMNLVNKSNNPEYREERVKDKKII